MKDDRDIVALLPIKAHSARVDGKNFRDLEGKPLFVWVLDTLLAVPEIRMIVINTDARKEMEDLGIRESEKLRIRDREESICGDEVSMNRILADDIAAVTASAYFMTHATNPFLSMMTMRSAIDKYFSLKERGEADSLFSVNKVQTRFYRRDLAPVNHDPDNLIPTQELEPWFEENSNLYIFSKESFARTNARIGQLPAMYETPRIESLDIDVEDDWNVARLIAPSIDTIKSVE